MSRTRQEPGSLRPPARRLALGALLLALLCAALPAAPPGFGAGGGEAARTAAAPAAAPSAAHAAAPAPPLATSAASPASVPAAPPASKRVATARNGMVVSSDPIASQVGLQVLEEGGNAVDAAIAVAFALAVVYPKAGNLGGGGFMLYRDNAAGDSWVVDFRETAPAGASPGMYLGPDGEPVRGLSTEGYLSAAVPGTVAGMELAHNRYGLLSWKRLVRPALRLARRGFPVSRALAEEIGREAAGLARHPSSAAIFLPGGRPPVEGSTLRQPDLARTLQRISSEGAAGFYRGRVAEAIAADVAAHGGILTAADLAGYRARIRKPVEGTYGNLRILSVPPPSSGGPILLQILNMLEPYSLGRYGARSAPAVHLMTEAEKRAYADRSALLGDPDFFNVPLAGLISKQYAISRAAGISMDRATPSSEVKPGEPVMFSSPAPSRAVPRESPDTTHFAVVDRWRNVVAVTTTLNDHFGSKAVAAGTGVLLNDEMDDFSVKPGAPNLYGLVGGAANEIRPGKRPLSSMSPTIVLKNNMPYLVLGTPGGATIITSVLQVFLNVVEFRMGLPAAVSAPRVHHQWLPDRIQIEEGALAPGVQESLRRMGHTIAVREPIGDLHAIRIDPARGTIEGVCDPRGPGEPRGY